MQIKATMRYYFMPVRMASMKKLADNKCSENEDKREPLYTADGNVNWCSHVRNKTEVPQKTKNKIYDPGIPLLGIKPEKN